MKALVVINDSALLTDVAERLARDGFRVDACDDATGALDRFYSDRPALVVIGWLRQGLDGLALCRKMRSQSVEGLPIFWIVTDRTDACDDSTVIEAGVDECLVLPLDNHWSRLRVAAVRRRIEELNSLQTAEEALRRSNERLNLAISGGDEGLWDNHPEPGFTLFSPDNPVWFSPRVKSLLGFTEEEFPNVFGSWRARLHPDDAERVLKAIEEHLATRKPYDIEYRLQTKSGEYRWFAAKGQAKWNSAGEMTRISGVLRDVTDAHDTAEALLASERKWRGLVEQTPDVITVTDLEGKILSVNRMLPGFKMEDVVNTNTIDHVASEFKERVRETQRQVIETGEPQQVELSIVDGAGTVQWISSRVGPIKDERGIVALVSVTTDITDRKLAEQERAKFFALVENSTDFIGMLTTAGQVLYLNPAGRVLVGLTTDAAALALPMADYYIDASREVFLHTVLPALQTSDRWTGELQFRNHLTGRAIDVDQKLFVIARGPKGEPVSLATITRDITDHKRYESKLMAEQEVLRRLLDLQERERQLVAYDIHDGLVQQMAGALMHLEAARHAQSAERREAEFDRGQHWLQEAVKEARRLISGLRPPVLDELGIVHAIEYLVNEAKDDVPGLTFSHHVKFGRLAPAVESAIFRIVQEGLANIRKHSGAKKARVELSEQGHRLRLVIRDWGRGFEWSKVSPDRFGLQGIRQRARLLGTVALIETTPGEGTVIVVDFPIIHADPDEESDATRPDDQPAVFDPQL